MAREKTKTQKMTFEFSDDTRSLLLKLHKLQDRSMTGVIEHLVKNEGKKYGLIESRE